MFEKMDYNELDEFVEKIKSGYKISDKEIRSILEIENQNELQKLFYVSQKVRNCFFDNKIILSSFVYFSTHCKNECAFCYYKKSNKIKRYRLDVEEVIRLCTVLKKEGVNMIDLTMGEDPYFHNNPKQLVELIRTIKHKFGLPIMISPGVIDREFLIKLKESGANILALYQETYEYELYQKLRTNQSFKERIDCKKDAKNVGLLVEDGILTGIEDSIDSIILSLREIEKRYPDMVRVMTFVPQEGTPLENKNPSSSLNEIKIIAIMRLMFPNRLIPASLDVEGIGGMKDRLNAGANVVTSIIPSDSILEGVVNPDREETDRKRDVKNVLSVLNQMEMKPIEQDVFNKIMERNDENKNYYVKY
ncbi:methylornithine synthase PylB [Methanococcoides sp. FTZ1]|uniref:methylornithine synthase PylB n=1 Tax=Methanococcoides sp. FTZ1 TaxID=3439061 RepID=UPI003F86D8AD